MAITPATMPSQIAFWDSTLLLLLRNERPHSAAPLNAGRAQNRPRAAGDPPRLLPLRADSLLKRPAARHRERAAMARFVIERSLRLAAVLVAITLFSFLFLNLVPGDPATVRLGEHATPEQVAQLRAAMGLDKPWYVQLTIYLDRVAHGDLGRSIFDQQSVSVKLAQYFPATVELAFGAMFFAVALGVPAGIAAAVWRGTAADALTMIAVMLGVSIPVFWLGWMLVYVFAVLPGNVG